MGFWVSYNINKKIELFDFCIHILLTLKLINYENIVKNIALGSFNFLFWNN